MSKIEELGEVIRIVEPYERYRTPTRELTQFWPLSLFNRGPIDVAGRHILYRFQLSPHFYEVGAGYGSGSDILRLHTVERQFKVFQFIHREWIPVETGDGEIQIIGEEGRRDYVGKWERGYYFPVIAYIPIPWPYEDALRWIKDLALEIGYNTKWIPMTPEFAEHFGKEWSPPMQIKLNEETGELIFRNPE
jgi:hypothetical protein